MDLEPTGARCAQRLTEDGVDHAAVAEHHDRSPGVGVEQGAHGRTDAVVECRDRLTPREEGRERIVLLPAVGTVPLDEVAVRHPVALRAGIVFAESLDPFDGQPGERADDDVGGLDGAGVGAGDDHVRSELGVRRPTVTQSFRLQAAEIGQADARAQPTDHPADGDDRFAVADENETCHPAEPTVACTFRSRPAVVDAGRRRFGAVARGSRLTIRMLGPDPRGATLVADAHALGAAAVCAADVADVVFFDAEFDEVQRQTIESVLVDPLLQSATWDLPRAGVDTVLLPGVTDAVADAVQQAALLVGLPAVGVATGRHVELRGPVDDATLHRLSRRLLANAVIETWAPAPISPTFIDDVDGHRGPAEHGQAATVVVRGLDPAALAAVCTGRALALDPEEMAAIAQYFTALGRDPTDVELETLAQTWSEHCAHKTFRSRITTTAGESITPLLAQLRATTEAIGAPFVRSAFVGNAGIVGFDGARTYALKAETHNHPSAIEPFGGANTGVGGVIRDVMGAAHEPIAVTDVLCFGPLDVDPATLPEGVLHPRLVHRGVVAGVADYGNKIGLPTVAGAVLYDAGYVANPLVYAGCIGVADDDIWRLPGPATGDHVVVIGGRTGRDGLRGATFSSATMDATSGDVAGASVQIGDPITEKLVIDALRELRGRYRAITDCGAGGLSSAVGEMAEGVGADVDVALVALKYRGLAPWEVWLSEAQERMVLAVSPSELDTVVEVCASVGVEATPIGRFTGSGRVVVRHGATVVLDLDTGFLHDGRPQRHMIAELPLPDRTTARVPVCTDPAAALLALLAHPTIASKEQVVRRFDHEIRGATVVRPLVGERHDGPADGVVLAEPLEVPGLAIGIGVNPWYGDIDPERMAEAAVDEAIRNVVAVGADPDRVALLDNFSWGDPRRPTTLGALVAAVQGCCAASQRFRAPFVSGKDSLNNEYLGSDGERHAVPPTLVITAVAHVPDARAVVTPDLAAAGHVLVLLGHTDVEFGGSHLSMVLGDTAGGVVPAADPAAVDRYRRLHRAISAGLVASCHDLSEGGLAVAVAEMSIAGRRGVRLRALPHADPTVALFSESLGRILCAVSPDRLEAFLTLMGDDARVVGEVIDEPRIDLGVASISLDAAVDAFHSGPDAATSADAGE